MDGEPASSGRSSGAVAGAVCLAVGLTLVVALFVWLYPAALEAFVARWGENAARRAASLAKAGRLAEAEAALAEAAGRRKVWIDADGRERQRVYLGERAWIDHRDFVAAAEALLAAGRPAAARRAAWEAIWRYHALNRAGEIPEPWGALADAAEAVGDEDTAWRARRVARAWSEPRDRLWPPEEGDAPDIHASRPTAIPVPVTAFRLDRDGRFNPANDVVLTSDSLFFDRPCVIVAAAAPTASAVSLRFEARSDAACGWPAIVVVQLGDETRFRVVDSPQWRVYEIGFQSPIPPGASLRIAYLNHGAEGVDAKDTVPPPRRRTLAIRQVSWSVERDSPDDAWQL